MTNEVLEDRLAMIEQNLITVSQRKHLDSLRDDLEAIGIKDPTLTTLTERLGETAERLKRRIARLRADLLGKKLTVDAAWTSYEEISDESSHLYREFLEMAAGVAMRNRNIDDAICGVADELIRGVRMRQLSLAIPAAREAYSQTVARLIRVRFPEKSVWTLPLMAHEFAHIVLAEIQELTEFADDLAVQEVDEKVKTWAAAPSGTFRKRLEAKARYRIHQLMADCTAVFTMGPCYACSAILLRFSPIGTSRDDESCAPEIERAFVVLEMLSQMNGRTTNEYGDVLRLLRTEWDDMLKTAGSTVAIAPARQQDLETFAAKVYDLLDLNLVTEKYQPDSNLGGWPAAKELYRYWQDQDKISTELALPEKVEATRKVRDALNAAWLCRFYFQNTSVEAIGKKVQELCTQIGISQGARQNGDRGSRGPSVADTPRTV